MNISHSLRVIYSSLTILLLPENCPAWSLTESSFNRLMKNKPDDRHSEIKTKNLPEKLESIYFTSGRSDLTYEAIRILQGHIDFLRKNPEAKLIIEGYSDSTGSTSFNMALAEKRARSAMKLLIDMGIQTERLTLQSYGEERPAEGDKPNEYSSVKQRRVDFKIIPPEDKKRKKIIRSSHHTQNLQLPANSFTGNRIDKNLTVHSKTTPQRRMHCIIAWVNPVPGGIEMGTYVHPKKHSVSFFTFAIKKR